jgi:hypothetical protein
VTKRPFKQDVRRSGISIIYRNEEINLIADQVSPRVPVSERFSCQLYDLPERFTIPDTKISRKGRVNRVNFKVDEIEYRTEPHGLEDAIPFTDIEAAKEENYGYDPEDHAVEALTDLVLLDREVRVANEFQNPNNYLPANTRVLSGTSKLSDYLNSDPVGIFKLAARSTILRANSIAMGDEVWDVLSTHPKLVALIYPNGDGKGMIEPQELARKFRFKNIFIGEGQLNTARKGQAANIERVWGNNIAIFHRNMMANNQKATTFSFTGEYKKRKVMRFEDPYIGEDGGVVDRVTENVKEVFPAKPLGYLIEDVI